MQDLLTVALQLSRHTANSIDDIGRQPMHITMALYNLLAKQFEEEAKAREEAEKEAERRSQVNTPSIPDYSSKMPR